jgi:PAS domain-containing protein
MGSVEEHDELLQGLHAQLREIFETSEQGIYLYLDDVHKVCNEHLSSLLGYNSPEEWADVNEEFTASFVDEGSRSLLVSTFQDAMDRKIGASIDITWKKVDGDVVDTNVILVPVEFEGTLFALHFITAK